MRLARRHGWWLAALAALAAVALLRVAGALQPLEHAAADARARLLLHSVESDIVIVGIDAGSLAALKRWPWPRRHHAALIRRLAEAGAARVFLDIDFSLKSNALDDAALEAALADWNGGSLQLPTFFQSPTYAGGDPVVTQPLERFARHAQLVAVNRRPGADGLERSWRSSWMIDGTRLPTVIDPDGSLPPDSSTPIDYSISPKSFAYLSFADVLRGEVPASTLRGKTVYVGATAVELGDMVPVPLHRSLPGVVVQALATESVRAGALAVPPAWLSALLLVAWTLASARALRARAWRRNALMLGGAVALATGASIYAHAVLRIALEVVPFALATAGVFLVVTLQSLDRQTWRAFAYALGMRRRDALLKSVVHSSTDCIVCVDGEGFIRTANPAAGRLFACSTIQLVGAPISRFIPGLAMRNAGREAHPLADLHGTVTEWVARTRAGDEFPAELAASRVRLPYQGLYTAIVRDISDRRAQQASLEHQATHDSLTQLPNRTALMQWLDAALTVDGPLAPVSLMMLDLCRFKEINDTLGHHIGDQVLHEVARRFQGAIGAVDRIARIGGDEFIVVVAGRERQAGAERIPERLQECLRAPIDVAGVSIEVGLSIGIACCPEDGTDAPTLLRRADVAMYVAKRRGTPFERYDRSHDGHSVRSLALGVELRAAIEGDTLSLHYQPQVDLRSGRVAGVEALLRWEHPALGPVRPDEFLAIAESTDLIRPLTEWTLRRALADVLEWRRQGGALRVAVNLSARLLQDTAFPQRLLALLESSGAAPEALELEITESAMMQDPARALDVVRDIAILGVRIAIDDFGTGYSSLGYLRDLPVQALKLDKSFVAGMRSNAGDRIIVESTLRMAHALGLEVVAEGIESQWEEAFLAKTGYDYGQGYHYSPALPAAACLAWMRGFVDAQSVRKAASAATWAGRRKRRS
jgi:diguanylate cyclase (GGDEF)-like protein/PAS domain S-box-containing protein